MDVPNKRQFPTSDLNPEFINKNFYISILHTLSDNISVINSSGLIIFVNSRWSEFSAQQGYRNPTRWEQINYLTVCRKSADNGCIYAKDAYRGINDIISGQSNYYEMQYPAHDAETKRYCMMKVRPFSIGNETFYLICHTDITDRIVIESKVSHLSKIDPLTNTINRFKFEEILSQYWLDARHSSTTVALAMIEVDYLESINTQYNYEFGDKCLREVSKIIKEICLRHGGICARIGGYSFSIIWRDVKFRYVHQSVEAMLSDVRNLKIVHLKSSTPNYLTLSAGLAMMLPAADNSPEELVNRADNFLYIAKINGRNCLKY